MIKCKDCKWWGIHQNGFSERPNGYKSCGITESSDCPDYSGEHEIYSGTMAYALGYEGALLYTSPEFGCIQGEQRG